MLRFVTHWFVAFGAPHTQNVFINYTCSRADALLYGTVLGHVCFLFKFTPDRARPEHKCCSLPLPLSIIPTQTSLQRPPFHLRSGVTSYTANLINPWPTVTAPNCSDNHMPVIWSGNRRGCWENWHKIFFLYNNVQHLCTVCRFTAFFVDLCFHFFTRIAVTPANKRPHSPLHHCLPQPWFKTYE